MAETTSSTSDSSFICYNPTLKASMEAKIADTIDRDVISNLPDAILCDILSLIPTRHAVATSVLSKRWKLLWTSIPNLDFSFDDSLVVVNQSNYMNFVDRVLSLNNVVHVREVYLKCTKDCDSSRVKAWTSAIVGRHTEDFCLRLPMSCCIKSLNQISHVISPPDSFFIRQNLVNLRLDYVALKVPKLVSFPNVKTIHLNLVQLLDDDSMKNLLAGCPVLGRLRIERGRVWDNAQVLYICSSTMYDLNLYTEHCDNKNSGYKVVIEAPMLSTLALTDHVNVDYDMNNISSMVEAHVNFKQDLRVAPDGDAYNERLFEFFRKISHIQDLFLGSSTMQALLYTHIENLPMFNNLTRLKVVFESESWQMLSYLLDRSPNLVTFDLTMECDWCHCVWYAPQSVPQCLQSSLENIEISGFEECDAGIEIINYFLKYAMLLKNMSIESFELDMKSEMDIYKLLIGFPRSSSTCQVAYLNQKKIFLPFSYNNRGLLQEEEWL